jgi:pyruvate,orthophosphate dikinase
MIADADERFRSALGDLKEMQRDDFEGLFREMAGLPVTIRLLDPPLHEFLPVEYFEQERPEAVPLVRELQEANPMLGTRGVRLAVLYPPIYEMQVRAIVEAADAAEAAGQRPDVEIMVPLIAYETELEKARDLVERAAEGSRVKIGTMIELPRACLVAERIAGHADFFSFGTNDLTQTALGLSRDDVEAKFLGRYVQEGIIDRSPFETIDEPGVGELVRIGTERGREANPELHVGVCGEHGGDPDSVRFFHGVGLDYVSCSPYRVPIARVAAAQAAAGATGD